MHIVYLLNLYATRSWYFVLAGHLEEIYYLYKLICHMIPTLLSKGVENKRIHACVIIKYTTYIYLRTKKILDLSGYQQKFTMVILQHSQCLTYQHCIQDYLNLLSILNLWTVSDMKLWQDQTENHKGVGQWSLIHLQVQFPGVVSHRWIKISGIMILRKRMPWLTQV